MTVASTVAAGELLVSIDCTRFTFALASAVCDWATTQLAVELGELLFVHCASARVNHVVSVLVVDNCEFGRRSLLPQLVKPSLQPNASALGRLVLGFELIVDIGIGNRVRDLRGAIGIERAESRFRSHRSSRHGGHSSDSRMY